MPRGTVEDPIKVFNFQIRIDGFVRAGFSEFSGIDQSTEEVKYREGGFNDTPQLSAGLTNFAVVTLKRGQIIGSTRGGDDDFLIWCKQVIDVSGAGNATNYRKDLDIVQMSAQNVVVRTWRLYECWPKGFKPFTDLKGMGNENSYEELRLAYEGFELVPT